MAALARILGVAMVVVVPGGLLVVSLYFVGRAFWTAWTRDRSSVGTTRFLRAVGGVRLQDVMRQVRASV